MAGATHQELLGLSDEELLRQCEVQRFRGSGPGGQKRNKTETAVRIRHLSTGLCGQSDDSRSQHLNKRRALRRLRRQFALRLRGPVRLSAYRPADELMRLFAPPGQRIGPKHALYLSGVAALLDLFVALDCSVRDTARRIGLSTGALSRFLLADGQLIQTINLLRRERGLRALR